MTITASTILKLKFGEFTTQYHRSKHGECISLSWGDLKKKAPVVRMHSSCLFAEVFSYTGCDCKQQLEKTLRLIKKNGSGVIIYSYAEGRGLGLEQKIMAMELERTEKLDTVEAFSRLGRKADLRVYSAEAEALKDLKTVKKIKLVSNNPNKIKALEEAGFEVERVKLKVTLNSHNKRELLTKKNKMGHFLDHCV